LSSVQANDAWNNVLIVIAVAQVDLGGECIIESITVWNRQDSPPDRSRPKDTFTKRLVPFWIITSVHSTCICWPRESFSPALNRKHCVCWVGRLFPFHKKSTTEGGFRSHFGGQMTKSVSHEIVDAQCGPFRHRLRLDTFEFNSKDEVISTSLKLRSLATWASVLVRTVVCAWAPIHTSNDAELPQYSAVNRRRGQGIQGRMRDGGEYCVVATIVRPRRTRLGVQNSCAV